MSDDELSRFRRFALVMGVLLISYVLAGIRIKPEAEIQVFSIPWQILRPDLLPIGLALGSLYGMARYWYYGLALRHSPYRERKLLLEAFAHNPSAPKERDIWTIAPELSWDQASDLGSRIHKLFPRFLGRSPGSSITEEVEHITTVSQHVKYGVLVTLPLPVRIGASMRDIDYTAPIWLNFSALALYTFFLLKPWLASLISP